MEGATGGWRLVPFLSVPNYRYLLTSPPGFSNSQPLSSDYHLSTENITADLGLFVCVTDISSSEFKNNNNNKSTLPSPSPSGTALQ